MVFTGQEYKQGLVIQRSDKGSAFQEVVNATIGAAGKIEATLPGGIKEVNVTTTEESGKPVVVENLPEAGEDYVGLVYNYNGADYVCKETEENVYAWVEQVDKGSELGNPLVYASVDDLPEASEEYDGKFAKVDGMVIHYYFCNMYDVTQEYTWFELQVIVPEEPGE